MVMIGTVTFDGLSQGALWNDIAPTLQDAFGGGEAATKLADTIGLLAAVGLVAGFYALGIEGARTVGGNMTAARLRRVFIHSLVPIACVYVLAHYLTYLVFEGQAIQYLASDPFGQGWDLFGTASAAIDFSVISQNMTWYLQVGFVVLGHVAALVLAHDRALATYGQAQEAVRSQYWMLGIMVGFTLLALWLLRQAGRLSTLAPPAVVAGGAVRRRAPHACHSRSAGRLRARSVVTRPVGNRSSSRIVYWAATVT